MKRNKENIRIDAYAFMETLKEYPKFDYRETTEELFILFHFFAYHPPS